MSITEIDAKTIIRKGKRVDPWFITRYSMNFYRGCLHNCSYCDGRSEKYYVEGVFGEDILVKKNAVEILDRELNPSGKRVPFKKSFMLIGGGVTDSYQPVEKKYQISRAGLHLFYKYGFPVHILTKSPLVYRDIDIIRKIDDTYGAVVSFSLSSGDDKLSKIFEPGVPSASERLQTLWKFKTEGVRTGVFLMPVIPFITDTEEVMEETIGKAKEAGADFIIFGGLTLKPGIQKDHFMKVIEKFYPSMEHYYKVLYRLNDKWGNGVQQYYKDINSRFYKLAVKYKIPVRMPLGFFENVLDYNSLVAIIMEHIDYVKTIRGEEREFGHLPNRIAFMKESLMENPSLIREIDGINWKTEKIIKEILETKRSEYYIKLMKF